MIAHHWAKLPTADVKRLRQMAKQPRPAAAGMTSRNMSRLRQLDDDDCYQALLGFPGLLLTRRCSRQRRPG
ncbi:MAG TPA: hypothetical protein VHY34_03360 [Caulobacteraceae bacterium]|jgi:hypothetical protein|nr:hypothetical protein [Caulobacteraceae bacterium]